MEAQVNIAIPQSLYQQAAQIAQTNNINVIDMIVDYLERSLFTADHKNKAQSTKSIHQQTLKDASVQRPRNIDREKNAYKKMHPTLLKKYEGEYVAIYEQKLVDHDADKLALYQRIDKKYPDQFVLMRPVEKNPEREIYFRSTRFVERA